MISIFEWIGEFFSRDSCGTIEFGGQSDHREPLYIVFIKFFLSVFLLVLISTALFMYLVTPTTRNMAIAAGIHFGYFLIAYFVRPMPDESNLGLSGTIVDDPFKASDDISRELYFLQILLLPGRFVSEAVVVLTARALGRKSTQPARTHETQSLGVHQSAADRVAQRRSRAKLRRIAALSFLGIVCAGCAIAAFVVWQTGRETQTWRPVEGRIVYRDASRRGRGGTHYEYMVNGTTYRSIEQRYYDPSERVTVFVDPQDPAHATLASGVAWVKVVSLAAISALAAMGILGSVVLTLWPQLASEEHRYDSGLH